MRFFTLLYVETEYNKNMILIFIIDYRNGNELIFDILIPNSSTYE